MVYDLKYIVANVMMGGDTIDERKFIPLLSHAINGYRELNLHSLITTSFQTKRLKLDRNTNIAQLPHDYLDYYVVGVVHKFWDGECFRERIITLDYNEAMWNEDPIPFCECNENTFPNHETIAQAQVQGTINNDPAQYGFGGFFYYAPRVNNGQYTAGIYGASSWVYRGSFIIDPKQKILRINSCIKGCDEVIIFYKSTGLTDMGNALIEEGAIPALLSYVKWKEAEYAKDMKWATYHMELYGTNARALATRTGAMTDKDIYSLFRQSYKQSVKG